MLEAYHKADREPRRRPAPATGRRAIARRAAPLENHDPEYVADVEDVLTNMAYAVIGRFIEGQIAAPPSSRPSSARSTASPPTTRKRERSRPTGPERAGLQLAI